MILALLGLAASAFAAEPRVEFRVEPRVELVAVVSMLGGRASDADPDYAREAREAFAPLKSHPAVAAVARLGKDAFSAKELDEFAAASHFGEWFKAHERTYRAWRREAQAEARRGQSVEDVARYLRWQGRVSFIVSGLYPRELETDYQGASVRAARPRGKAPYFELDDLGRTPAHEFAHKAVRPRIQADWDQEFEEALAFAVTFRTMTPEARDRELPRYAPKVPGLAALYEALGTGFDEKRLRAAYAAK